MCSSDLNKDKKQLNSIYEEVASNITFDDFIRMFEDATEDKYSFLYIDLEKADFRRSFNSPYHL